MFDPTIGVWLQEDPIGFDGGDPNLRRYVGNNGVNSTDRNGLQEKEVGPRPRLVAINGKPPTPAQAREYEFKFELVGPTVKEHKLPDDGKVELVPGLTGTIKVTSGVDVVVTLIDGKGKRIEFPRIQEGIIIELTAPKNAEAYRWMQFVTRIPTDNKGDPKKGSYKTPRPEGVIHKYGEMHVDTLSSYTPFADEETFGVRDETRSMIYDPPSLEGNERLIFDAYLISTADGRPVYRVHWEMWGEVLGGEVNRKFENISGKPVKILPLSLSSGGLPAGYFESTGEPNVQSNPVKPEYWHPLAKKRYVWERK